MLPTKECKISSTPRNDITNLLRLIVKFTSLDGHEIWAILGYYAARGGNSSPTFRDNLSVPSSRVKNNISYIT